MDRLKAIIIILLLVAMMFVPFPLFLGEKTFLAAILHHIWHCNWFHLAINCISVWLIVSRQKGYSMLAEAWGIASISYIFAATPVVGFSNILFAMSGIQAANYGKAYWKQPATWSFFVVMIAMAFFPMFSTTTHLASFGIGYLFSLTKRTIKTILNDYERILGR